MTSVISITFFVVCVVSGTVFSLSKQDFSKAKTALKNLENFMKSQASSINSKIHALHMDMAAMEKDFDNMKCNSGIQWMKYNKHCYHIETKGLILAEAEKKCKEFGGYLAKIDSSSENNWVRQKLSEVKNNFHYNFWIGSAKVINGAWRWKHDNTRVGFTKFYSRRPFYRQASFYQSFFCLAMTSTNGKWTDVPCNYAPRYICEKDSCS